MARIFTSYKRADRPFLDKLLPKLRRAHGMDSVWFDEHIPGGVDWWKHILEKINQCDVFIYLLSNDSLRSPYCINEFREALRLKKHYIPVVCRLQTELPDTLPERVKRALNRTQRIVLMDSRGEIDADAMVNLNESIREMLIEASHEEAIVPSDSSEPTPEPAVDDFPAKKSLWQRITEPQAIILAALIGLAGVIIAALIQAGPNPLPAPTPTTTVAENATEMPATTSTLTLTATVTPGVTNTPDSLQAAFTPIARNTEWAAVERDFDGVTMVLVPAGSFNMGSGSGFSAPVNRQEFNTPFWIDKTEVTRAVYGQCVDAGACREISESDKSSLPNQPIININWFQANEYCLWRNARLPTEREWEYAARGPDGNQYPWGNTFATNNTVFGLNSGLQTSVVGSRQGGVSWIGAVDMSGNVFEWTSTIFDQDRFPYPYINDEREDPDNSLRLRVLRGGSWVDGYDREYPIHYTVSLNTTNRARDYPYNGRNIYGVRCVKDVEE